MPDKEKNICLLGLTCKKQIHNSTTFHTFPHKTAGSLEAAEKWFREAGKATESSLVPQRLAETPAFDVAYGFRFLHPFYIHVQLAVMSGFLVVQHAQIEKCIPRRFCIKQNNHGSGAMIHVLSSRGELRKRDWTLIPRLRGRTLTPRASAIASLLLTGLSGSILHHWVFFCIWTG